MNIYLKKKYLQFYKYKKITLLNKNKSAKLQKNCN